jgi:hypothetical protein
MTSRVYLVVDEMAKPEAIADAMQHVAPFNHHREAVFRHFLVDVSHPSWHKIEPTVSAQKEAGNRLLIDPIVLASVQYAEALICKTGGDVVHPKTGIAHSFKRKRIVVAPEVAIAKTVVNSRGEGDTVAFHGTRDYLILEMREREAGEYGRASMVTSHRPRAAQLAAGQAAYDVGDSCLILLEAKTAGSFLTKEAETQVQAQLLTLRETTSVSLFIFGPVLSSSAGAATSSTAC